MSHEFLQPEPDEGGLLQDKSRLLRSQAIGVDKDVSREQGQPSTGGISEELINDPDYIRSLRIGVESFFRGGSTSSTYRSSFYRGLEFMISAIEVAETDGDSNAPLALKLLQAIRTDYLSNPKAASDKLS